MNAGELVSNLRKTKARLEARRGAVEGDPRPAKDFKDRLLAEYDEDLKTLDCAIQTMLSVINRKKGKEAPGESSKADGNAASAPAGR
ncbi:MAG: hypothetical protein KIS92_01025 [Planctomycetota bacterium]|nr:hypothetical protein [Planctomycetota bacterium]